MQDPTPLKQAGEDEFSFKESARKYLELEIEAAACLLIGFPTGAAKRIDKQQEIMFDWANRLGVDVQAELDRHATRIQEGG